MEAGNLSDLYKKSVTCPICNNEFEVNVVKVNAPRILSKDSDFFIRYKTINPYFYDVWCCNKCGYASLKSDFDRVKSTQKTKFLSKVSSKWNPREYPDMLTIEQAIERYKLALVSSITLERANSSHGFLSLKIAWMYRLLEKEKEEIIFLSQAIKAFNTAYVKEGFPIYGLQRDSIIYLIGDLHRRVGNNSEALTWYSKVITTVGASQKIKEMARDGKDLIKNSNKTESN